MKKTILLVLCLVLAATCLVACHKSDYAQINEIIRKPHDVVDVEISATLEGETLTSTFRIAGDTITYHIEQFNKIDPDLDYKTVTEGSAVLENGKIVRLNGEDVQISFDTLTGTNFNFNRKCFKNATFKDGKFTADVTSPSIFLRDPTFAGKDVTVEFYKADAHCEENAIENGTEHVFLAEQYVLQLCYVSENGSQVSMKFTMC